MPNTLKKLESQIARLQAEADKLRRQEAAEVIARIKAAIAHYGFTAADLGLADAGGRGKRGGSGTAQPQAAKSPKASKPRVARVRYSDGTHSWSGFGPKPAWLKAALAEGKTLEQLAVTG